MNPCKLQMSFKCIKAYMLAFSGRFSRASLEGISFKFFVCFIFNVSLGSAPKRKNFDMQCITRVGSGGQFTSNRLSCHLIILCNYKITFREVIERSHWQILSSLYFLKLKSTKIVATNKIL